MRTAFTAALVAMVLGSAAVTAYSGSRFDHTSASRLPPTIRSSAHKIVHEHTLLPPHLSLYGVGNPNMAHWSFGLSAVVTDDYVRLTAGKQSREGYLWNDVPVQLNSWKAHLGVRVHSNHALGGDAMALWLAERPSTTGGPVVATRSSGFRGLGIIFDSFDNDHQRDNPSVIVVAKLDKPAGELDLNPSSDYAEAKLGGCSFDYRNSDKNTPVNAVIEYNGSEGTLVVKLESTRGATVCTSIDNFQMPAGYFFGMTAHTGEVADTHDVHWFVVTSEDSETDSAPTSDIRGADDVEGADARIAAEERRGGFDPLKPEKHEDGFDHDKDLAERTRWMQD